jgi:hypothetical protein
MAARFLEKRLRPKHFSGIPLAAFEVAQAASDFADDTRQNEVTVKCSAARLRWHFLP